VTCKGFIFAAGEAANAHLPPQGVDGLGDWLQTVPRVRFGVAVMVKAGVRQLMIGAPPHCIAQLHAVLGDGNQVGGEISYLLLESDSSIEKALLDANRYVARSSLLVAMPSLCCSDFHLKCIELEASHWITSFRMRDAANGAVAVRPALLHLGNGTLLRLKREAERASHVGSTDLDQFRRAIMSRFKYRDLDLTDQCVSANLSSGLAIDPSLLSEQQLFSLLS